jgi:hypothetical protein
MAATQSPAGWRPTSPSPATSSPPRTRALSASTASSPSSWRSARYAPPGAVRRGAYGHLGVSALRPGWPGGPPPTRAAARPALDKSTERIDGIVALIIAIGRAMVCPEAIIRDHARWPSTCEPRMVGAPAEAPMHDPQLAATPAGRNLTLAEGGGPSLGTSAGTL